MNKLARLALDPGPLHKFIEIVEHDLGFFLYRAVSRAKEELSTQDRTEFRFQHADIDIQRSITRTEFEAWIREDVDRIAGTVDEALRNAGVSAAEIDMVFLTGGSSFIPVIQRIFADRFGADRIASGDQFEVDRLWAGTDRPVCKSRRLDRAIGVITMTRQLLDEHPDPG